MDDRSSSVAPLSSEEKAALVEKKATCPFVGSAIAQGALAVRNSAGNPLASLEEIRSLGNSGGGDLGDLLVLFASGNHAKMRGASGRLDTQAPGGLFSLEFPGSQGSHPGHSGILQGDPTVLDSGRFSPEDYARLAGRAEDGLVRRSAVGHFIAENLLKDPGAKVFGLATVKALGLDLLAVAEGVGTAWMRKILGSADDPEADHRAWEEKLTKLLGEDNLVGAAGEFGLLFALLANRPGAREIDDEPTLALPDLDAMFVHKRLPEGWETWKKSRIDWVKNTAALLVGAGKAYLARRRQE